MMITNNDLMLVKYNDLQNRLVANMFVRKIDTLLRSLESTFDKSSKDKFRVFIDKYDYVAKWILISDYCINDKTKPNNVISFVFIPYILDFKAWSKLIDEIQPIDIKHTNVISDEICSLSHNGNIFSINFLYRGSRIPLLKVSELKNDIKEFLKIYDELLGLWCLNATNKEDKDKFEEFRVKLKRVINNTKQKSYNFSLLSNMIFIVALASYLKTRLQKEVAVDIFSWLSDRDKITGFENDLYLVLYTIISHCMSKIRISDYKSENLKELLFKEINKMDKLPYDSLNRLPDLFCGILADYDYIDNKVSSSKHCFGVEKLIADNQYCLNFVFNKDDVGLLNIKSLG